MPVVSLDSAIPKIAQAVDGKHLICEGLERVEGIEPSYSAWKAAALPLSYTRIAGPESTMNEAMSRCRGTVSEIDQLPTPQGAPRPLRLAAAGQERMVGEAGLEPAKA
jgi:hypothetical protein